MTVHATQLHLFTKRKRPASSLTPAIEFRVHCMVADVLRISLTPGWYWMHYPAGELRKKATAGRLKRMGVKAGVSDFLLIAPGGGQIHVLELKRRGCKPSKLQQDFLDVMKLAGGKAAWCDSFDRAIEILKGWGAVRVSL